MSITNYSGFLSNFSGATGSSSGGFTDILSKAIAGTGNTDDGNYGARYFTIGNILVQFTDFNNSIENLVAGMQHTITFPKSFVDNPYCVVVTPTAIDNRTNSITVLRDLTTDDITPTSFKVYIGGGEKVGLTYIAIGPGPPGPI
jgi:hypothetical protein